VLFSAASIAVSVKLSAGDVWLRAQPLPSRARATRLAVIEGLISFSRWFFVSMTALQIIAIDIRENGENDSNIGKTGRNPACQFCKMMKRMSKNVL
jgi:hypothetical protein